MTPKVPFILLLTGVAAQALARPCQAFGLGLSMNTNSPLGHPSAGHDASGGFRLDWTQIKHRF